MKPVFLSLALILTFAQPALSATQKKKTTVKTEVPATIAPPAPAIEQTGSRSSGPWAPSASAGLGSLGSSFSMGVLGTYMTDVTVQNLALKAGVKTGFILGFESGSSWAIPVMGTANYSFPNGGSLRPYAGMDLGMAIVHSRSASVEFAALFYPGAHITNEIFAELPFGTIAGSFFIFPSVGMRF